MAPKLNALIKHLKKTNPSKHQHTSNSNKGFMCSHKYTLLSQYIDYIVSLSDNKITFI